MGFAVLERLMQRHLMAQRPVDLSKPAMMLLNNSCGLIPNALLLYRSTEVARWAEVWAGLTAGGAFIVALSCVNALAISYMGLRVQQMVTATTFMVLTNVNKFVVIGFGVLFLHEPLTLATAAGVMLATGGGVWYAKARARALEFAPAPSGAESKKLEGADGAAAREGSRDEEMGLLSPATASSAHADEARHESGLSTQYSRRVGGGAAR